MNQVQKGPVEKEVVNQTSLAPGKKERDDGFMKPVHCMLPLRENR